MRVDTQGVDTDEATKIIGGLCRLFKDITSVVPDWMETCKVIPMLPTRASKAKDNKTLKDLCDSQARYIHVLENTLAMWADVASESDFKAANLVLPPERRKLALLHSRLDIYNAISEQMEAFVFNEQRLPSCYKSKNETKCVRTLITLNQAKLLF